MTPTFKLQNLKGVPLLIATTLIWGTSFPVVKDAVSNLSPAVLVAVRVTLAAIVFIPWLRWLDITLIRDGFLLGVVYFAGYLTVTLSLETTSASRSAFIVSLHVILVPLLMGLLRQRLPKTVFLSAGLTSLGIWMMSWEGKGLNIGDGWALICAFAYAVYIVLLGGVTAKHTPLTLTAVQLWVMALLSLLWASPSLIQESSAIVHSFGPILYLGLVSTAITTWTQAIAQRRVPAYETALIYTLEPVFATIFSFWLLKEQLGTQALAGAGLVLTAMLLNQRQKPPEEIEKD